MNTKYLVVVAMAVMLVGATALATTDNAFADRKRHDDRKDGGYGKSQSLAQASECGNGFISVADFCQEIGAQNQGKENSVAQSGNQEINIDVTREQQPPTPPTDVGCPAGTLWDITLQEDNTELGLEAGTVLCLTENRPGNQDATIADTNPPEVVEDVIPTPLPGNGVCPSPSTLALHTSGTAPNAFEQGGELCLGAPGGG